MRAMDPYAVLGVRPGSPEHEIAAAYREQAKRWHPDRAGADERMAEINAAYDLVRAAAQHDEIAPPSGRHGHWLIAPLRLALGPELLDMLTPGEDVRLVTPTSTWASPRAILAVTERRLLWLLDDAPVARVHSLAFRNVAEIEHRVAAQARDADRPHAHGPPPRLPRAAPAHCGQDRAATCWNDRRASYRGRVRVADPVHNVELRRNAHGHEAVVFAFPYRADIVDAVRAIPGRRFDWQAKEWWAPRVDATAAYVQGVLERFPELDVAPEVSEWLSRAVKGWVGRVTPRAAPARAGSCSTGSPASCPTSSPRSPRSEATGAGCRSRRRSPRRCSRSCRARGWISARRAARPSCRSAWSPRRRR